MGKSSVDEETTGELRWEKPDARKGKEITEAYGKHNRTGNGENINRSTILSRRGTLAKKREQRWDQIEASMWENEEGFPERTRMARLHQNPARKLREERIAPSSRERGALQKDAPGLPIRQEGRHDP